MQTRRDLIRALGLGGAFVFAAGHAAAQPKRRVAGDAPTALFPQGVASGDPSPTGVVLWARVAGEAGRDVALTVQVSPDPDFGRVVVETAALATAEHDHTVRILVDGLAPDRTYHFRFLTPDGLASRVGRTRTAPRPGTERAFTFATASCQNFQTGHYHAYRSLLEREQRGELALDFILFLGDFIYELVFRDGVRPLTLPGRSWTSTDGISGTALSYQYAETLEDYRYLYRTYLTDPALQDARAAWPFLTIWDDHEFSNDAWQAMSTYTDDGTPAQRRRLAATQAWFEYIPARLTEAPAHTFRPTPVADAPFGRRSGIAPDAEPNNLAATQAISLLRKVRWGALAEIILTDSRSYRSEPAVPPEAAKQVSLHPRALLPRKLVGESEAAASPHSLWGQRQVDWVTSSLAASGSVWKFCASSVPMMPLGMDFRFDRASRQTVPDDIVFTIDSWEGYPAERRRFLQSLADADVRNAVVLSADHHMHIAGRLELSRDGARRPVAAEFCVAGISSTSLGDVLKGFVGGEMKGSLAAELMAGPDGPPGPRWMNLSFLAGAAESTRQLEALKAGRPYRPAPEALTRSHLAFVDVQSYGVALATVSAQALDVAYETYAQSDLTAPYGATPSPRYVARLRLARDDETRALTPAFTGKAPFPYA